MSEIPKVYLTPEQWAVVEAHERRRTELVEENTMKTLRFQAELLDKFNETLPAMKAVTSDRDHFAMSALNGIIAHNLADGSDFLHELGPGAAAMWAYRFADAMLKARDS